MCCLGPTPSVDRVLTAVVPATTVMLAVLVGTGWLHLAEPLHTAVAIVGPAAVPVVPSPLDRWTRPGGGAPGRDGDEVGIAATPFLRAVELLSGALLADEMANEPDLLVTVLGDGSDEGAVLATARRLFAAVIGRPTSSGPDPDRLRAHLRTRFRIEMTSQPGLRRISYRHADPRVARDVVTTAVRLADAHLHRVAQEHSAAMVTHLRRQLADGTGPTERRLSLAAVLEDQERRLIVLGAGLPHAIEFVGGPAVGIRPDEPDPTLVLIVAAGGGFAVGLLLLRLRRRRDA